MVNEAVKPEKKISFAEAVMMVREGNEEAMKAIGYGYTLHESEIDKLDEVITDVLNKKDNKAILEFRDNNIYNLGKSGEIIADYLINNNLLLEQG